MIISPGKYILAPLLAILATSTGALPCTTIIIGKDATADGSIIVAHNEDMGFFTPGRLWYVNPGSSGNRRFTKVPYVTLPAAPVTLGYWASGNTEKSKGLGLDASTQKYDNILVGLNQRGVTIACNWAWSREKAATGRGIRRYAIRQLVLERALNANDAVTLIGNLIDRYGQADWGGLIYIVADPDEAWIVETTAGHWASRKVRDREIAVVANRFTIGSDIDRMSPGLIRFALKSGWHKKNDIFNFSKSFTDPTKTDQAYDTLREMRAYHLLRNKRGAITPSDLFALLRDRYDGTALYTPPLQHENWRDISEKNGIPRTINTNLIQSSSVAQLRSTLPVEIGAVLWHAMANPAYNAYMPLYAGAERIPGEFKNPDGSRKAESAWWAGRMLAIVGDRRHKESLLIAESFWKDFYGATLLEQVELEKKAKMLIMESKPDSARDLLTGFTTRKAEELLKKTRTLLKRLSCFTNSQPVWD